MNTQIKTILTPVVAFIAAWIAHKIPFLDSAAITNVIDAVFTAIAAVVIGYFNRPVALVNTVGNMPGTTVVTTPAIANALPENRDVIAATPQVAAAVSAAK